MLHNKRADLELSIRTIVIVILAMTILGFGLSFMKNMFGNIEVISGSTFDKIKDQLQRDLISSNEKLIFSQTKVNMERGRSELFGWGIKNQGNSKLEYWAEFTAIKCPGTCPSIRELNEQWFTFKYNPGGTNVDLRYSTDPADQDVVRVDLTVPREAQTGLYLIDLSIYDAALRNEKYASTDIFLTVT